MDKRNKGGPYKAIVQRVFPEGPHGAHGITTSEELPHLNDISFSFKKANWEGPPPNPEELEEGTILMIDKLVKKRGGWRAQKVRFFRPEDEEKERR